MTPPDPGQVRFFPPPATPIVKATDLGSVQVLKHANLFLLTDPFGDIHADSRGLGLYRGDTRLLSCEVLRVGGVRPVLLQGSMGGNYRGTIHLTNASIDRNPGAKRGEGGRVLPVAVLGAGVTSRYEGLDDVCRSSHVAFSDRPDAIASESERPN